MKNKEGLYKGLNLAAFALASMGSITALTGIVGVTVMTFGEQPKICNDFKSNTYFIDTLNKDMAALEEKFNNGEISQAEYDKHVAHFSTNTYVLEVMKQYEQLPDTDSNAYQNYNQKINMFSYMDGAGLGAVALAVILRMSSLALNKQEQQEELGMSSLV